MNFWQYLNCFQLGINIVFLIIIIVMALIIKASKNRKKALILKQNEESKKFNKNLLRRGAELDEKIKNAKNRNDLINIHNDVMHNKTDSNKRL